MKENKCPLCPKEYQSEKKLSGHVSRIHGVSYKLYKEYNEKR